MFLVGIFHSWWFKGAFGWNQTDSKCFSSGLYIGIIYAAHRSEWHHCQGRRQVMVKMDSGLTAVVCPPGVDTAVFLHPAQGRWGKVEEKNQQKGAQRIKPGFQKLLRSYTRKKKENACLAPTMIYVLCPQGGRAFSDTVWSPWAGLPGRFVWKPTGVGPLPTLSQWWIQQEKKKISKVASVWSLGRFGFRSFSATICETWFFQIRRSVFNSQTLSCMFLCFFFGGGGKKGNIIALEKEKSLQQTSGKCMENAPNLTTLHDVFFWKLYNFHWKLKMMVSKRDFLVQGYRFSFHIRLLGVQFWFYTGHGLSGLEAKPSSAPFFQCKCLPFGDVETFAVLSFKDLLPSCFFQTYTPWNQ